MRRPTPIERILCLLWGIGMPFLLLSQSSPASFRSYGQAEGLSQSNVTAIDQDEKGFIWVGTHDGLNRFDGYEFRRYDKQDGLCGNFISGIHAGASGIWVATSGGGLCLLHPETDAIETIPDFQDTLSQRSLRFVARVLEDQLGNVWVCTLWQGLWVRPSGEQAFRKLEIAADFPRRHRAMEIREGPDGLIWCGTNNGLVILSPKTLQVQQTVFENEVIIDIAFDHEHIWLASVREGLYQLDKKLNLLTRYSTDPQSPIRLNSDHFLCVGIDEAGNVWTGTNDQGVDRLILSEKRLENYRHEAGRELNVSSNYVRRFFKDRDGGVWLGVFGAGLDHYSPYRRKFRLYKQQADNPNSLSHNYVYGMSPCRQNGADNQLWIATHGSGINHATFLDDGRVIFHHLTAMDGLSNDIVLNLTEDDEGGIWMATFTGLSYLPAREKQKWLANPSYAPSIKVFDKYNSPIRTNYVWSVVTDSSGKVWIGTSDGLWYTRPGDGFAELDLRRQGIQNRIIVNSMYCDRKGRLWAGTHSGAFLIDPDRMEILQHYQHQAGDTNSLSNPVIKCFGEDLNGRIWIGTDDGLNILINEEKAPHFYQLGKKNGLPNPLIKSIVADQRGNMWVGSNWGLSMIQTGNLPFKATHIRNFDIGDGLQSNEFSENSGLMDEDGNLYFGGAYGLNVFHPDELRDDPNEAKVEITGIRLVNTEMRAGQVNERGNVFIEKDIAFEEEINLHWQDDLFSIHFAGLNFVLPEKNRYRYRLDGFDRAWREAGEERMATYTNLDGGTYRFRIQAANHDGLWNQSEKKLSIHIASPPWQRPEAYLL
ncbi:MAG: two-component regulator propeller domain-containing protein, partial [Bacteroidota bacterium]